MIAKNVFELHCKTLESTLGISLGRNYKRHLFSDVLSLNHIFKFSKIWAENFDRNLFIKFTLGEYIYICTYVLCLTLLLHPKEKNPYWNNFFKVTHLRLCSLEAVRKFRIVWSKVEGSERNMFHFFPNNFWELVGRVARFFSGKYTKTGENNKMGIKYTKRP
jgi:hypothetical protein